MYFLSLIKAILGVPVTGFKNNDKLKSNLVRAVPPDINEEDICGPCGGKVSPCQSWSYIKSTNTFKSKH